MELIPESKPMSAGNLTYAYHLHPPTEGWEALRAEHERCVALWDRCVDIDRAHERGLDAVMRADTAYASAADVVDALRARLAGAPRLERCNIIHDLRAARSMMWAQAARWSKQNREEIAAHERDRRAAVKAARQASDAWWPNYNSVIARYEAARRVARQFGRRLRHHDPLRDDGMLCVQIQRTRSGLGAASSEIEAGLSMLQLRDGTLMMRVDTAGNMVRCPAVVHRPLPEECRIKAAQLTWRIKINSIRWGLHLQITGMRRASSPSYTRSGTLALSWEEQNGGLHVARIGDDRLVLPSRWMARMDRVETLASWLDTSREFMLAARPDYSEMLDMPVRQMLATILERHSTTGAPASMRPPTGEHAMETIRRWADEAAMAGDILGWRRWWKQVWQARLHLWDRLLGERREIYRIWAGRMVLEYPDICLDETRLDRVARAQKRSPENSLRQRAAVHLLRDEIVHQARKRGCRITANGLVIVGGGDEKTGAWLRKKAIARARSQQAPNDSLGPAI